MSPLFRSFQLAVLCLLLACTAPGCDDDPEGESEDADSSDQSDARVPDVDLVEEVSDPDTNDITDADVQLDMAIEGDWLELDMAEVQPGVDPNGASDVTTSLMVGEVRAGVVAEESDRVDFRGFNSRCRIGDFKLYNRNAAFCIEGPTASNHLMYDGGRLIDAVLLSESAPSSADELLFLGVDLELRGTAFKTVEVVRDGSDGGPAVIRSSGTDEALRFLIGLLGSDLFSLPPSGHNVVTEFRLHPDSQALEIVTWVGHPNKIFRRTAGDFIAVGDHTRGYVQSEGVTTDVPQNAEQVEVFGKETSYRLQFQGPASIVALAADTAPIATSAQYVSGLIPAGKIGAYSRTLYVGDGSTFSLDEAQALFEGSPVAGEEYVVTLQRPTLAPIPGVLAQVFDPMGNPVGAGFTNASGQVRTLLPPGMYNVQFGEWDGTDVPDAEITVAAGGGNTTVTAPPSSELQIEVNGREIMGTAAPMPARVLVEGPNRSRLFFTASGRDTITMPPGDYNIEISRGLEYTAYSGTITLTPNQSSVVNAELIHVLTTPEHVSGEFHQHGEPSIDSDVPVDQRVLENLADGVDFMSPSDHDVVWDYVQTAQDLGISQQLFVMNGAEVSPVWGHINGLGIEIKENEPGRGAPLLAYHDGIGWLPVDAADIVRKLRDEAEAKLVQINHPRDSGLLASIDFDPEVGLIGHDERELPRDFDMIELFNSRDQTCEVMRDWYAFLNEGYRIVAVGNSDTHGLGAPAGFPRNYIRHSATSPADLTAVSLAAAIKTGDLTIAGGAVIETGGMWQPGATLNQSGTVSIPVTVRTPPWSRVTTLITVVNGVVVDTQTADPLVTDLVDFDVSIDVTLTEDSWIHFIAWGPDKMSVVYTGDAPFAITNPVYLDVDGDTDNNGQDWEPPGADPAIPTTDYAFCTL